MASAAAQQQNDEATSCCAWLPLPLGPAELHGKAAMTHSRLGISAAQQVCARQARRAQRGNNTVTPLRRSPEPRRVLEGGRGSNGEGTDSGLKQAVLIHVWRCYWRQLLHGGSPLLDRRCLIAAPLALPLSHHPSQAPTAPSFAQLAQKGALRAVSRPHLDFASPNRVTMATMMNMRAPAPRYAGEAQRASPPISAGLVWGDLLVCEGSRSDRPRTPGPRSLTQPRPLLPVLNVALRAGPTPRAASLPSG